MAACHLLSFQPGGGEGRDHFGKQLMCPPTVVAAEVADIDIECDAGNLGPGMDGQVRFGEHNGAGDAGRLAGGIVKGVKEPADDRQAVAGTGRDTE